MADVKFDLGEGNWCDEVTLSNTNVFCFYTYESRHYIKIRSFINSEMESLTVEMFLKGRQFKIMHETRDYVVMIHLNEYNNAILIIKVHKRINYYEYIILNSYHFNLPILNLYDFFNYYDKETNELSIFIVSNIQNTLNIYSSFLDMEKFTNTKIRTINDFFYLHEVDKNIWGIDCHSKV